MSALENILSSRVRAEIFRLLFGAGERELHLREIERQSGYAIPSLRQEFKKLLSLDIVKARRDGNRLYYRANVEHPLFIDLQNMVLKTVGLVDILKGVLVDKRIRVAFVYGSIAKAGEGARSDIDLMVIGNLGLRAVSEILGNVHERIGREINPYVISLSEFTKRKRARERFLTSVLGAPKLFIIGSENDLRSMGG
jgi:DNA-binding transcriptional ArsR family regulator